MLREQWKLIGLCVWLVMSMTASMAQAARPLARASGTDLRVMAWNVSCEQFFEREKGFIRVLRAIDADILILDEMPADRSPADVLAMLDQLKAASSKRWQIAYGSSGKGQRTVFALHGTIAPLAEFAFLPYPVDYRAKLDTIPLKPAQASAMRQSLDAGVAAFGINAQIGKRRLLLVGVDLQCCGDSDDAWEEQRRIVEAHVIRGALDQAWDRQQPDAVIVGGDFNAVRGLDPLRPVQGDNDASHRHLAVAQAMHANGKDHWTWDGRGTPFPSKPLDFLLHSDALQNLGALVFDPETMSSRQRARIGLRRDALLSLSEHRPLVVDLRWRRR